MKHPYVAVLLADHPGRATLRSALPQGRDWHLHYEIPDTEMLHMIAGLSLPPPRLLMAESTEAARQMGIAEIKAEYPESSGWRNHRAAVVSAEKDFLLYERALQYYPDYYERLRLFMVSGIVIMKIGALMNRFTIVGICAGNSDGEAFLRYRDGYIYRAFLSELRSGFVVKTRVIPEESVRAWREADLKNVLDRANAAHIGGPSC